jgi:hypothetical protein
LATAGQRIDGNVHGAAEIVARRVDIAAGQFVLVGKGDGVNDEVEPAPGLFQMRENGLDRLRLGHVAMTADDGVQFRGERFDALLQRVALIGEGQLRALFGAGFRNAPCDGLVVGKADDEAALAFHEARTGGHGVNPNSTVV